MAHTFDISECFHGRMTFDFELRRGDVLLSSNFDPECSPGYRDDAWVITYAEGLLVGHAEKSALAVCSLSLLVGNRPVVNLGLADITPHDSVLEARVRRLESLVDGILSADNLNPESDDEVERRMAERRAVLVRLGWQPYDPADSRRIDPPLHVRRHDLLQVKVTCGESAPEEPVLWRLSLVGVRKALLA